VGCQNEEKMRKKNAKKNGGEKKNSKIGWRTYRRVY
jgi:hypothetical protein